MLPEVVKGTKHFCQYFKAVEMLGKTHYIFDLNQIQANIKIMDVWGLKMVVKWRNISADIMLGKILRCDQGLNNTTIKKFVK